MKVLRWLYRYVHAGLIGLGFAETFARTPNPRLIAFAFGLGLVLMNLHLIEAQVDLLFKEDKKP